MQECQWLEFKVDVDYNLRGSLGIDLDKKGRENSLQIVDFLFEMDTSWPCDIPEQYRRCMESHFKCFLHLMNDTSLTF